MDQSKIAVVVERVRGLVLDGALAPGDALPSTRSLASELGVARGTVVAAYEQLDGEGWIRTRQGAVARIAVGAGPGGDEGRPAARPAERSTSRPQVSGAPASGPSPSWPAPSWPSPSGPSPSGRSTSAPSAPGPSGSARAASPGSADGSRGPAGPATTIDCRPGIPAVTAIAERDWRAAWRAAASAPLRNDVADPLGTPGLREGIVVQLGISRGVDVDPTRVLVAAGTSEALSLLTEALTGFLGRPPRIAVEDPGHRSGRRAVTSAGGVLVPVPVDDEGLVLDALRAEDVDAVLVTPTHQYPLGSVMPVGRRRALLALAASRGAVVVEDDYDSEFRHRGDPVPALAALDTAGVVVHLGGFSKVLDPRLRCSWVVVPPGPVGAAVVDARTARGPVVAEPVQVALAHLLRTGAMRRHLGRVRRDYTHKRARIAERLGPAGWSGTGLEAMALSGGLHTVVRWPGPVAGRAVVRAMADRGVRVEDLAAYEVVPGRAGNGVVLGYGQVTLPDLDRALDALGAALGATGAVERSGSVGR